MKDICLSTTLKSLILGFTMLRFGMSGVMHCIVFSSLLHQLVGCLLRISVTEISILLGNLDSGLIASVIVFLLLLVLLAATSIFITCICICTKYVCLP